jgi:CBS domain-containing protein
MQMEKTRVRDIMTSPAIVITPDTSVPAASALMKERGIRHLPVVENGRLAGIVSRGDLREASISASANADTYEFNFLLNRLAVGRLMTRQVLTITADAPVVQAAELMTERKVAGLPVVAPDGSVTGIVTESDLLKMLVRKLREAEDAPAAPDTAQPS